MSELEEIEDWSTVVGQDKLVQNLKNALHYQKISHAYMIQGEKLSGKRMLANIFARALQCESDSIKPCNQCRSCKQAINQNHPDIIYVEHDKPNVISVDNIRLQINGDIAIKPYSGKHKIYIVDEAEKMNQQAMNALLKTLEEPPEYAVIMFLTTSQDVMLPTIISRCVVMNTKPVSRQLITNYLMMKKHIPDYRANVCANFARGNIGRAIELASNEEFDQMKAKSIGILARIFDTEINEFSTTVKKMLEDKVNIEDFLDLCMIWYRDVLLMKSTKNRSLLVFTEYTLDLQRIASKYTYEAIERITKAIEHTRSRIHYNVNEELSLEVLFFEMQKPE